jgi:hypothetical protein
VRSSEAEQQRADSKFDRDERHPTVARGRSAERWRTARANRQLLILFVELQLADILTTNAALARPGVSEANPLMALSQWKLGAVWWLPKLAVIGLLAVMAPWSRRRWPLACAVSVSAIAVLVNLVHL